MNKKVISAVVAAMLVTSNVNFVLADNVPAVVEDAESAEILAAVDGLIFEVEKAQKENLVRTVKVKYAKDYFTTGINNFKINISVPTSYAETVTQTNTLSGFDVTESYAGGVFTCEGTCDTNRIPADNALFTMKIKLKENAPTANFTVQTVGDTYVGDETGTTLKLSNGGMTAVSATLEGVPEPGWTETDGAITLEYRDGLLKIHGNGTMHDYAVGEAPWFNHDVSKITKIEFTSDSVGIMNIGKNAFNGLTNLEEIDISKATSLSTINESALEGCSSLKKFKVPENNNVGIGNYAFKNCTSLTTAEIPSNVATIGQGAFEGCSRLNTITIPFVGAQKKDDGSKKTFSYIFGGNVPTSLKTVNVTNETVIPDSAFEDCSSISTINVNGEVYDIGAAAFKNCTSLSTFKIPSAVTVINKETFQGCSSLQSVDITDAIIELGAYAFDGCKQLRSIYVPANITYIGDYTFRNCSWLTNIEIPVKVQSIGVGALQGCNSLIGIKVPFVGASADVQSVNNTERGIFGYLFGVTNNSDIPPAVTSVEITSKDASAAIPKEAFKNCSYIVDIIVDGARVVGDNAFENCMNLKVLTLPKSISTLGTTILRGCTKLETLTIPFVGFNRNDVNKETSVLGGFFGYDDTDMFSGTYQYYNDSQDGHYYKIPKSLKKVFLLNQTSIPAGAFSECDFIKEITVVTGANMGSFAFYHCRQLETAVLPGDMQTIGRQAFAECESLESINIPNGVKTIGENSFYNARSLKNITMPDSITTIAGDIFNGTGLFSAEDEADLLAADVVITCSEGSAAHKFAIDNGYAVNLVDSSALNVKSLGATMEELTTGDYFVQVVDPNKLTGTVYVEIYDASGKLLAKDSQAKVADEPMNTFEFTKAQVPGAAELVAYIVTTSGEKVYDAKHIPDPVVNAKPKINIENQSHLSVTDDGSKVNVKGANGSVVIEAVFDSNGTFSGVKQVNAVTSDDQYFDVKNTAANTVSKFLNWGDLKNVSPK